MINDDEQCDFISTQDRVARKDHQCSECGRIIRFGEQYRHTFIVYEGHGQTFKTCQHCLIGYLWLIDHCGHYALGDLLSDLDTMTVQCPEFGSWPKNAAAGMRRKWRAFEGDGLMPVPTMPEGINARA